MMLVSHEIHPFDVPGWSFWRVLYPGEEKFADLYLLLVHFSLHMALVRLRIHWFHFTGHGHQNIMEQPVEWLLEEKKKNWEKILIPNLSNYSQAPQLQLFPSLV